MVINWIDWVKVLGMFTIIWGHCFPNLFSDFLYAFNVPVFFFLSGYLTKRETSSKVFWNKLVKGLVIPYFILSLLKAVPYLISPDCPWSLLAIMTGFHTLKGAFGCGKLWFIYTLIFLKIVRHYTSDTNITRYSLYGVSLIGIALYHYAEIEMTWAVTNSFLAMPWFLFGQEYKGKSLDRFISNVLGKMSHLVKTALTILLMCTTYFVSIFNGRAYMYQGEYGNNFILYIVAGILGIFFILMVSKCLDRYSSPSLRLLSIGTIVILAYHQDVNHPMLKFVRQSEWSPLIEDVASFICSVITLIAFIPIIYIISRYLPIVIGNRKTITSK